MHQVNAFSQWTYNIVLCSIKCAHPVSLDIFSSWSLSNQYCSVNVDLPDYFLCSLTFLYEGQNTGYVYFVCNCSTVDVDISSCIISLTDLYTHWLTLPIHSLLLHHVLMSIVMLSDLFALVR